MCSYYYNPKLGAFFFLRPIFFTRFHRLLSQDNFSWAEEETVLLKEGQWLSGGPGGAEWRAIKGRTVWVDAAALLLHAEVLWYVTDLSVTPGLFYRRQRRYADLLNPNKRLNVVVIVQGQF